MPPEIVQHIAHRMAAPTPAPARFEVADLLARVEAALARRAA